MKLSKGQGMSIFTALIVFALFNIVVFLAPLSHTIVFWLGYFFALFALIVMALTISLYFGKSVKEDKFLNLPAIKVAWAYLVLQTAISVWEMTAFPLSYLPALIINAVLGAIFSVLILTLYGAAGKIDKAEQFTAEKVIFIKQLKLQLDSMETEDAELSKQLKALAEDVRFSDPMSHSMLAEVESALQETVDELEEKITDTVAAIALCKKASKQLKRRNEQCKMYKGVKDPAAAQKQKSDNGFGLAFAGVGVAMALILITLAVCFYIVPENKYNDAVALMKDKKYVDATEAFTELGDYKDSEDKIEEIKTILLDRAYDAAITLMKAEKYDEATISFKALGNHRDSKEKIEEIKTILLDNQYATAETFFDEGHYAEAMSLYKELGDYKDSKLRIEQIHNRLSEGDIIYFGTFNGEPIAWKMLKVEENKMLLITEKPIAQKPFDDQIKNVTWETCALRQWLNNEFMTSFSADQQKQILTTNTGDTTDQVFLLDVDEMNDLVQNEHITFKNPEEFWTRTATENGIMYTAPSGWVQAEGEQIMRDKGVRPAIWIDLE